MGNKIKEDKENLIKTMGKKMIKTHIEETNKMKEEKYKLEESKVNEKMEDNFEINKENNKYRSKESGN